MATIHLGLGSNLGSRRAHLVAAVELLNRLPGTKVNRVSSFVETTPIGGPTGQDSFLNAAAELETMLTPRVLLERLQNIETRLGRARSQRWGPRPIDLDILLWGGLVMRERDLTIPHPRMHYRRFVLEPLLEIAADVQYPTGWSIRQRWDQLNSLPRYLAVTGPMGVGKTTLASALARRLNAEFIEERFDGELLQRVFSGDRSAGELVQNDFLSSRASLLNRRPLDETLPAWVVSDFWFAQSLAYAELISDGSAREAHASAVTQARATVMDPILVVWLDSSTESLEQRVRQRGRACESTVSQDFLTQLRAGFERVLTCNGAPPIYRPHSSTESEILDELLVVAAAITG